jgi:hypothetical protein
MALDDAGDGVGEIGLWIQTITSTRCAASITSRRWTTITRVMPKADAAALPPLLIGGIQVCSYFADDWNAGTKTEGSRQQYLLLRIQDITTINDNKIPTSGRILLPSRKLQELKHLRK